MFTEFVIMSDPVVVAASLVSLFAAVVFLIIKGSSNLSPEETRGVVIEGGDCCF